MELEDILKILPLTVVFPLGIAAFKLIFKSFTLDNFDLLFYTNEKKSLYRLVRNISSNIIFIVVIYSLIFASAFLLNFQNSYITYIIYIWVFCLILFGLWLASFYGFIVINFLINKFKNTLFQNFRLKISNSIKSPSYLNLDYMVKFIVCYFSGIIPALIFLSELSSHNKVTQQIIIDNVTYLILILIMTILLLMLSKKNLINHTIKFKYVGSYHNTTPPNIDMYLDKILDNSTHILIDKSNEHRAIKYINQENFDFVIRHYKAEKIERNSRDHSETESED